MSERLRELVEDSPAAAFWLLIGLALAGMGLALGWVLA